jgi:ABC-2 type transport system ATP-binding protein
MRSLATEGRTVFVSSHLMSEMALTADHVIVIGRGKLIRDESMTAFIDSSSGRKVRVRTPDADKLRAALAGPDVHVADAPDGSLEVGGCDAAGIGEVAFANGVVLHELTPVRASLEEAFMELTQDSVEFHAPGNL